MNLVILDPEKGKKDALEVSTLDKVSKNTDTEGIVKIDEPKSKLKPMHLAEGVIGESFIRKLKQEKTTMPVKKVVKEELEENKPVRLYVEFEKYERYGSGGYKKAKISGKNLKAALLKMLDNVVSAYVNSDDVEEEEEDGNIMTAQDILDRVEESNGDRCDFITLLKDEISGTCYIDNGNSEVEEFFDDEDEDGFSESVNPRVNKRITEAAVAPDADRFYNQLKKAGWGETFDSKLQKKGNVVSYSDQGGDFKVTFGNPIKFVGVSSDTGYLDDTQESCDEALNDTFESYDKFFDWFCDIYPAFEPEVNESLALKENEELTIADINVSREVRQMIDAIDEASTINSPEVNEIIENGLTNINDDSDDEWGYFANSTVTQVKDVYAKIREFLNQNLDNIDEYYKQKMVDAFNFRITYESVIREDVNMENEPVNKVLRQILRARASKKIPAEWQKVCDDNGIDIIKDDTLCSLLNKENKMHICITNAYSDGWGLYRVGQYTKPIVSFGSLKDSTTLGSQMDKVDVLNLLKSSAITTTQYGDVVSKVASNDKQYNRNTDSYGERNWKIHYGSAEKRNRYGNPSEYDVDTYVRDKARTRTTFANDRYKDDFYHEDNPNRPDNKYKSAKYMLQNALRDIEYHSRQLGSRPQQIADIKAKIQELQNKLAEYENDKDFNYTYHTKQRDAHAEDAKELQGQIDDLLALTKKYKHEALGYVASKQLDEQAKYANLKESVKAKESK